MALILCHQLPSVVHIGPVRKGAPAVPMSCNLAWGHCGQDLQFTPGICRNQQQEDDPAEPQEGMCET